MSDAKLHRLTAENARLSAEIALLKANWPRNTSRFPLMGKQWDEMSAEIARLTAERDEARRVKDECRHEADEILRVENDLLRKAIEDEHPTEHTIWPMLRVWGEEMQTRKMKMRDLEAEVARLTAALMNADREVRSLTVSLDLVKDREERLTAENTQLREANDLATRCHEHDHKCTEKIVSALRQIAGLDYDSQCCTEDEECTHEACLNTFRARAISRAALARLEGKR